jgi:hypothetical protein
MEGGTEGGAEWNAARHGRDGAANDLDGGSVQTV